MKRVSKVQMTPTLIRWAIGVAITVTVTVAVGAFVLSFEALSVLAEMSGIPASFAWIWPIVIDGLTTAATVALIALAGHGWRALTYPRFLLLVGASTSIAANALHAVLTPEGSAAPVRAALVAASSPLFYLLSTHLVVVLIQLVSRVAATATLPSAEPVVAVALSAVRAHVPAAAEVATMAAKVPTPRTRLAPISTPRTPGKGKSSPEQVAEILAYAGEPNAEGRYPISERKIAAHFEVPVTRVHHILVDAKTKPAAEAEPASHAALSLVEQVV